MEASAPISYPRPGQAWDELYQWTLIGLRGTQRRKKNVKKWE